MNDFPDNIQIVVDQHGFVKIKKIEYPEVECEDCGCMVQNRVTEYKLYTTPCLHWKHKCKNCGLYQNPESDCFEFTLPEIREYYRFLALNRQKG